MSTHVGIRSVVKKEPEVKPAPAEAPVPAEPKKVTKRSRKKTEK